MCLMKSKKSRQTRNSLGYETFSLTITFLIAVTVDDNPGDIFMWWNECLGSNRKLVEESIAETAL